MAEKIGFIGAGQMARALACGFVEAGLVQPAEILASDVYEEARNGFINTTGCAAVAENSAVVAHARLILIAVKPQGIQPVLAELAPLLSAEHLVVSIVTGVSLAKLAKGLGDNRRIVRVMPNTPCLVGASASAFAVGPNVPAEDAALVKKLLDAVGLAVQVPEPMLDGVTGLSGSGPAYVYQVIEALSDGGVRSGLPRDIATKLAAQTVLGAAKMVLETGMHPGLLKDMVTSPGGTTIAGLSVLESRAVRGAFIDAVHAAANRAKELGAS